MASTVSTLHHIGDCIDAQDPRKELVPHPGPSGPNESDPLAAKMWRVLFD